MSNPLELTQQLVSRLSITPEDDGCQKLIADRLSRIGFHIEHLPRQDVDNLYARHGHRGPLLLFVGHTDVVPSGPREHWHSDPFIPTIRNGHLYGRGVADMKGSLAAMVIACERFFKQHPHVAGSVAFLITSDEEGPALHGTRDIVKHLQSRGEQINYCIVGEPSCETVLGDTIKVGRRGSLSGMLTIQGQQGHIAYPHRADNPIHRFAPVLQELCAMSWDSGNADFPPTSFQISTIQAGIGSTNTIPGQLDVKFNFRFSNVFTVNALKERVIAVLNEHRLQYKMTWQHSGDPFLTPDGPFRQIARQAVNEITGITPVYSTSGGTSDGRFIAQTGAQVIEFGLCNPTIHQVNECVKVNDLEQLAKIYERMMVLLLTG